jgi:hypothetical protein
MKPCLSRSLCTTGGRRTAEDRTPRSASATIIFLRVDPIAAVDHVVLGAGPPEPESGEDRGSRGTDERFARAHEQLGEGVDRGKSGGRRFGLSEADDLVSSLEQFGNRTHASDWVRAALELFIEQGYDNTAAVEIAERAGLTNSTFFCDFPDKREVLFVGHDLPAGAPRGRNRRRRDAIAANSELQERDALKRAGFAATMTEALQDRWSQTRARVSLPSSASSP